MQIKGNEQTSHSADNTGSCVKIKLRSSEIELPAHVSFYLVFFLTDKHVRLAKGTCRLGRSRTLMGIYVYLVEEYYMGCSAVPRNPDARWHRRGTGNISLQGLQSRGLLGGETQHCGDILSQERGLCS